MIHRYRLYVKLAAELGKFPTCTDFEGMKGIMEIIGLFLFDSIGVPEERPQEAIVEGTASVV